MKAPSRLREAQDRLARLSPERLQVAGDFLAYLEEREADEATIELLAIPGLAAALQAAEAEVADGRLTPVAQLRRRP
jgi:hypothetical protein